MQVRKWGISLGLGGLLVTSALGSAFSQQCTSVTTRPGGLFCPVDPHAFFFGPGQIPGEIINAPTEISLSQLRAKANDYLLLKTEGWIKDGTGDVRINYYDAQAAFRRTLDGLRYFPSDKINHDPNGWLSNPDHFSFRYNADDGGYRFIRVPKGANSITFATGYRYQHQPHLSKLGFGVRILRPNLPPIPSAKATPISPKPLVVETDEIPDEVISRAFQTASRSSCKVSLAGPLNKMTDPPVIDPQYRGWYKSAGRSSWRPDQSRFCPATPADPHGLKCPRRKPHFGADIFAFLGSELASPVDGCLYTDSLKTNNQTQKRQNLGNIAWIQFYISQQPYLIMFAHLEDFPENDIHGRKIKKGDVFATAGCSGNAITQYCDYADFSPEGGLSQHVHVEVVKGDSLSAKIERLNPGGLNGFGWKISCTGEPC